MSENIAQTMDIQRILALLPHRYPFLLVDRVMECVPKSHIRAYKNVSFDEPFFQGHFPGRRNLVALVYQPGFQIGPADIDADIIHGIPPCMFL